MIKKKPKRKKEKQPTLFAFNGSIQLFNEGSMLELHSQITSEEWVMIVEETIKYKIFLECLKNIAVPILQEDWSKEDEWFIVQLNIAISRMKNIDPLLVASHNQEAICDIYTKQMKNNAEEVRKAILEIREAQKQLAINEAQNPITKIKSDI